MKRWLPGCLAVLSLLLLYITVLAQSVGVSDSPRPWYFYLPLVSNSVSVATPTFVPTAIATPGPTPSPTSSHPHGDIDAPHLVTWSLAPTSVNTENSSQAITFTAHITDDLSGVIDFSTGLSGTAPQALFESPSGQQSQTAIFVYPDSLISGTAQDGIYQSTIRLPRFSETGEWKLNQFLLTDNVGNHIRLNFDDVSALGLPISFTVTN